MTVKPLFPNADGHVMIVCAHCGTTRSVPATQFRAFLKPRQVQCRCGVTFFVRLEIRKFYRKHARLDGTYSKYDTSHPAGVEKGKIFIEDLSRTGIGFRTARGHNLRVNAVLLVHVVLDDRQKTNLRKSAVVRHVDAQCIGAEFLDFDSDCQDNRALRLYLLPAFELYLLPT